MALLRSQINIKAASDSISSLSKGVDRAQKSANTIGISLRKRIAFKRESIRGDQISFYKRREAVRRKEQEGIIEAGSLQGAAKRTTGIGAAITDSTKGFLGRMMDFVGTIFVGWLLNNLPVIINTVKNIITRIKRAVQILSGFLSSTINILFAFGDSLVSIATNIATFDFTDESGRVKKSFSELEDAVKGLGTHFDEAASLLDPLGTGPGEQEQPDQRQEEPPGPGEQSSDTTVTEQTAYESTGGQKIKKSEFGSRGFRTRDGLGSGRTAFGHTGRDVPMPQGTPLSVVPAGTVIEASYGYNGGYGNLVVVKLDDGRYIKINHLSSILVKEGDRVGTGSGKDGGVRVVGKVGSTGLSTGPHMHLDLGTGYNRGPAQITGLMDPDSFILNGGIVKGGSVKSTGQTTTTRTTSTSSGTPSSPSAPSGSSSFSGDAIDKKVLDFIADGEASRSDPYGGFNTSAGRTSGRAVDKTIGWLAQNAQGAIGRYQHMPAYILDRAIVAGFNENTKFTPEVQDKITLKFLQTSHSYNEWKSGKISAEDFLSKLAPTWRAIPQGPKNAAKLGGSPNATYNDRWAGGNAAKGTWEQRLKSLKAIKTGSPQQAQVAAQPSTPPPAQTTSSQSSTSTAAQITPPPTNAPAQMQSLTPERNGNQVVVTPQQIAAQQPPQQPMTGGGGARVIVPDPQILLNRFMTTRLLLDLAYT